MKHPTPLSCVGNEESWNDRCCSILDKRMENIRIWPGIVATKPNTASSTLLGANGVPQLHTQTTFTQSMFLHHFIFRFILFYEHEYFAYMYVYTPHVFVCLLWKSEEGFRSQEMELDSCGGRARSRNWTLRSSDRTANALAPGSHAYLYNKLFSKIYVCFTLQCSVSLRCSCSPGRTRNSAELETCFIKHG